MSNTGFNVQGSFCNIFFVLIVAGVVFMFLGTKTLVKQAAWNTNDFTSLGFVCKVEELSGGNGKVYFTIANGTGNVEFLT